MTYWLDEAWKAIGDRLLADTAAGGLFGLTGKLLAGSVVYNTFAGNAVLGDNTDFPRIVFEATGYEHPNEAFDCEWFDLSFDITTYVVRLPTTSLDTMLQFASIQARVIGNWWESPANPPVPDYGLARYKPPDLVSGWACNPIEFLGAECQNPADDGLYVSVQHFKMRISKVQA